MLGCCFCVFKCVCEKRAPGWLGYIGDEIRTTHLYGDYKKPLYIGVCFLNKCSFQGFFSCEGERTRPVVTVVFFCQQKPARLAQDVVFVENYLRRKKHFCAFLLTDFIFLLDHFVGCEKNQGFGQTLQQLLRLVSSFQ